MKRYFLLLITFALLFKEGSTCGSGARPVAEETTVLPSTEGTESSDPPDTTTAEEETTRAEETTPTPSDPLAECLGPGVKCKVLKDGNGIRAETGEELECDFDGAPGCDCWSNKKPDDDQNEWVECSGKVDPKAVQACFKTSDVPSGKFIATYVTTREESGAQAILFSCTITCAMGGTITVKQWTRNADLKACFQSRLDALASPVCQEFQTDGAQTIEFLPSGEKIENFDVQLTASDFIGDDGGIAVIDDIKIYLEECVDTTAAPEETTTKAKNTKAPKPGKTTTPASVPVDDKNACAAECGVNSDVDCQEVFNFADQEGDATAQWEVYDGVGAGNFDSGVPVPEEGKFYGAEVGPGDVASMLTTNQLNLAGKQFRLRHYDATDGAQIKMCLFDESIESSYGDCKVESDLGWSESDLEWKSAFSSFDQKKLSEDARFHIVCDNENGVNYGACGFTDLAVVDDGAPQVETGPLQCTP